MIHWNAHPDLFSVGPLQVRWYSLMFIIGFAIGFKMIEWMCKREGKPLDKLDTLLFYVMGGTLLGARLGHTLFYEPGYYLAHPLEILMVWRGGLASHGGTAGVILALWIFSRRNPEFSIWWLLDRLAVPTAIISAMIRIGNLFNSEILGKPTDVPWAFIFERVDQIPRHPAQLYESITYFILFFINIWLYKRDFYRRPGFIFGFTMIWIFLSRIFWEFFKENQEPFEAGMLLNMGQILSIPFVLLGLFLVIRGLKKPMTTDTAPAAAKKKRARG